MKKFKVYPKSVTASKNIKAGCGSGKKYVKSADASYDINELEDLVRDILDEYKFNVGEPMDDETFDYIADNIDYSAEGWDDDELVEIAQYFKGSAALKDMMLKICREIGLGFAR